MSLILEALRKSEAERRRGESPGLRAELPPAPARPRRAMPAWSWIALATAALLVLLAALWPRNAARVDMPDATPPPTVATTTGTPAPAASARQQPPARLDALPPVERIEPRAAEPDDASGASPAASATTAPPPVRVETPTRVDQTPEPAAAIADTPAPARTATVTRPTAASPAGDLPRLSELPPAQRKRLPAMKLSMHLWNADPARRFAIIDGHRQVEGDRVGDATITAIDADGVVLELDGRPVRLPLR